MDIISGLPWMTRTFQCVYSPQNSNHSELEPRCEVRITERLWSRRGGQPCALSASYHQGLVVGHSPVNEALITSSSEIKYFIV